MLSINERQHGLKIKRSRGWKNPVLPTIGSMHQWSMRGCTRWNPGGLIIQEKVVLSRFASLAIQIKDLPGFASIGCTLNTIRVIWSRGSISPTNGRAGHFDIVGNKGLMRTRKLGGSVVHKKDRAVEQNDAENGDQ